MRTDPGSVPRTQSRTACRPQSRRGHIIAHPGRCIRPGRRRRSAG